MLIDIVQLPNRVCGESEIFSTKLPPLTDDSDHIFGRDIPIKPFRDGIVKKYKLIESSGRNRINERIFLSYEDLKLDDYTEFIKDEYSIYPLQLNQIHITSGDSNVLKYRNGIANYIFENVMNNDNPFSNRIIGLEHTAMASMELAEKMNSAIPTPDYAYICDRSFTTLPIDTWLDKETYLKPSMYNSPIQWRAGAVATGLLERENCIEDAYLYDNNPIEGNWELYKLVEYINSLAMSSITIEVNLSLRELSDIKITKYSNIYLDFEEKESYYSYDSRFHNLKELTRDVIKTKFSDYPWRKIVINKTWTEEIFIDVYCEVEGRSNSIVHVSYIDLIPFILGTVRLY